MRVGTVVQVWRYPVKSMQGEQTQSADIQSRGIVGDRGWALRDELAGEIRGARNMPKLLLCRARYLHQPDAELSSPSVEVAMPDGSAVTSDDDDADQRLSALLGREVQLCPLRPAEDLDHYRRTKERSVDPLAEARAAFGLSKDEALPDLSTDWPADLRRYATPPGAYHDIAPLHLLSTASLEELRSRNPTLEIDVRRFRPSLLIDTGDASGFVENDWLGKRLSIGDALIDARIPTVRCAVTTQPQPGLDHDPGVMRTLVRETDHRLGAYAWVVEPGKVRVGDAVELMED